MFIKRPGGTRRSYSLVDNYGKTVKDKRIDRVNLDLAQGVAIDILEARMKLILDSYKPKAPLSQYNVRIAQQCQEAKLKHKGPDLVSPYASERRLLRAAHALGEVSIAEATTEQLHQIANRELNPGSRYHLKGGINELLRFVGRDLRLFNPQPKSHEVKYIDYKDFVKAFPLEVCGVKELYLAGLLASGARFAELPCIEWKETWAFVPQQLSTKGTQRPTKNKSIRSAPLIPPLKPYLMRLKALPLHSLEQTRLHSHKSLWRLSNAKLGITIHNLRHSYSIAWLKEGRSIAEVARWIGDTEATAKRHYTKFLESNMEMESIAATFKG